MTTNESSPGSSVMSELHALLRVQQDDDVIRGIEARRDALGPRVLALDKARQRAIDDAARNEAALGRELDRLHALEERISEHKIKHEKNLSVLNQAHKLKEATAAMAQVEAARRVLAEEESELLGITRRIAELRATATSSREAVEALEAEQVESRANIASERAGIDGELAAARTARERSAKEVSPSLLSRYDRVHSRRKSAVVFALGSGFSCGSCDTAIPLQRRPSMASGNTIATCEVCGVLLYQPMPGSSN
jgi:predicted  nucleic acid-binding Zn-ribbon protein